MNNKGFTLVEVLVVVVLLGLIFGLAVPGVTRAGKRAKEKTLINKVNTIEKAAVLFGQQSENNTKFTDDCEVCNGKQNCKCLNKTITVQDLIDEELIQPDDENDTDKKIVNPTDSNSTLNNCTITIYKKYGKIYATYNNKVRGNDCWASR